MFSQFIKKINTHENNLEKKKNFRFGVFHADDSAKILVWKLFNSFRLYWTSSFPLKRFLSFRSFSLVRSIFQVFSGPVKECFRALCYPWARCWGSDWTAWRICWQASVVRKCFWAVRGVRVRTGRVQRSEWTPEAYWTCLAWWPTQCSSCWRGAPVTVV